MNMSSVGFKWWFASENTQNKHPGGIKKGYYKYAQQYCRGCLTFAKKEAITFKIQEPDCKNGKDKANKHWACIAKENFIFLAENIIIEKGKQGRCKNETHDSISHVIAQKEHDSEEKWS